MASAIYDLGCAPLSVSKRQFCDLMAGCAPLHPVSALALARLCRKFGQNQRSLFSFLTSRNVNGFASFVERDVSVGNIQFFGLSQLYDYTADSLGSGLNIGEAGTRWAEVTTALEAHRDLSLEETQAVKAIGLLSAIGPYGELKPSLKLLQIVLGHGEARKVVRTHSRIGLCWSIVNTVHRLRSGKAAILILASELRMLRDAFLLTPVWRPESALDMLPDR